MMAAPCQTPASFSSAPHCTLSLASGIFAREPPTIVQGPNDGGLPDLLVPVDPVNVVCIPTMPSPTVYYRALSHVMVSAPHSGWVPLTARSLMSKSQQHLMLIHPHHRHRLPSIKIPFQLTTPCAYTQPQPNCVHTATN
ncbi:hypothetical protein P171DRAFT_249680 [Karstenula rhodostoma CBS 690.94]|uniref:Uncharacterized protein n=1 Tax=Karstenula rhodostoma CBS 690.94 TaxID=1392251 RepID=A0A9P4PNH9_9PLEO|nr:hypothetical protein P171DRAFT_249680 [Karstenula rhodostoma CBS 690.94]